MSSKLSGIIVRKIDEHFKHKSKAIVDEKSTSADLENYSDSPSHTTKFLNEDYMDDEQNDSGDICGISVIDGQVIINNKDIEKDNYLTIMSCEGIKLYINGELCEKNTAYNVTALDEISAVGETIRGSRNITISISSDCMRAYLDLIYKPEYIYKLKDIKSKKNLKLKAIKEIKSLPEKYSVTEIMNELGNNGIKFGILKENISKAITSDSCYKFLIAEGKYPIDDKPTEVRVLFDVGDKIALKSDTMARIDYKNVYSISNVEKGRILAEIIPEEKGEDGKNVKGETIKRIIAKSKPIKAGEGCKIEGNNIIATRNGRPSSKNGVLSVNNVYNIQNVDMKSGNINFIGDVEINGTVGEGMTVKAGNSVVIRKDVDNAKVMAGGEISILGNVIHSNVHTGQIDMEKKEYLDILKVYKESIDKLIEGVKKLNECSNCTKKISDITRILIENRFKDIPKLSLNIISRCIKLCDDDNNELIEFLRSKMMGLNISNIKTIEDLNNLSRLIEEEIDYYGDDMIIQSDIYVSYLQDSLVKSTGNIFVTGKGEYVTNLIALKNIEFMNNNAVARGGLISARGNVKLGTVGSTAGVSTRIEVPKDGIITADIAYANTVFVFGKRSKTLNEDSRKLKAYVDKDGEIIIEKLKL